MRYFIVLFACFCCNAQPLPPVQTKQIVWVQPNPTNVTGYQLKWGTNTLNIDGVSNTSAIIKLDEGINTLILRAAGTNTFSDPITNITRLVNIELHETTNAGASWQLKSNYTYAIGNYRTSALYRTKLNWIIP